VSAKYIRVLAQLVHPPAHDVTVFAMFKVYLDEAGIEKGSEIVTVAGVAMTLLRLSLFSAKWSEIIKAAGITEFKAKNFFYCDRRGRRGGEFGKWSEDKAQDFLGALLRLIKAANPVRVGTSMVVADFNVLSERARRYLTGAKYNPWKDKLTTPGAPNTPFHVPMQYTVLQAAKERPKRELAHFVCDRHDHYAGYVVQRFNEIAARHPKAGLGDIVHSESHKVAALQAADLLCYLLTKQARHRLQTGTMEPIPLLEEIAGGKFRFDYLDRPVLENELLSSLTPIKRVAQDDARI